ncbi:hypothetical protein KA183_07160 [bacterium]|nr:hypothetical protein [bacterium]
MITKKLALLSFGLLLGILSSCADKIDTSRVMQAVDYIDLPGPKSIYPSELCRWKDQDCLIQQNRIFRVDGEALKAYSLPLPEKLNPIVRLGISQDKRLIGVSSKNAEGIFFIEDGDKWKEIPLPIKLSKNGIGVRIAAKGDKAVFKLKEKLYFWDGKKWLNKFYFADREMLYPHEILIGNDELYLAFNHGIHGGALAKLDLRNENDKVLTDDAVADIDFDSSGKLWCLTLSIFEGLQSLENDKLVGQCGVDNFARTGVGNTTAKKTINWPLETANFQAMTSCDDDSFLLGGPSQGIFRYKDHKAVKLVAAWNKNYELDSIMQLENGKFAFTADGEGLGVLKENCLPRSVSFKRN